MAFGDILQSVSSSFAQTQTCAISSPVSGNALFFIGGNQLFTGGGITTPPAGWTEIHTELTGNLRSAAYYKVSDGTETSVVIVWAGGSGVGFFCEIDFDGNTLVTPVQTAEDTTNVTTLVTSQNPGSVTPANATNVWVGAVYVDQASNLFAGRAWTDTVTDLRAITNLGQAQPDVVAKVNIPASAFNPTFSSSGTADEMYGVAAVFEYEVAGGGSNIPVIKHHLDQMAA